VLPEKGAQSSLSVDGPSVDLNLTMEGRLTFRVARILASYEQMQASGRNVARLWSTLLAAACSCNSATVRSMMRHKTGHSEPLLRLQACHPQS
jgi:hypothetical protein